jgi:hypothetical protein
MRKVLKMKDAIEGRCTWEQYDKFHKARYKTICNSIKRTKELSKKIKFTSI